MPAVPIEELTSPDGRRRARILKTDDGRFLVDVDRRVAGEGPYEPPWFWSPDGRGVSITDTLENARRLAIEALGPADAG